MAWSYWRHRRDPGLTLHLSRRVKRAPSRPAIYSAAGTVIIMTSDEPANPAVPAVLQRLWGQRRAPICDRIEGLAGGLRAGMDATSRADLTTTAHQLHGLLGTFGLSAGSELAGQAEALLESDDSDTEQHRALADQLSALARRLRGPDSGQDDSVRR